MEDFLGGYFFWRNFLEVFFWRIFLEGFFQEDFLGGILWEELLSRFLQGIDVFVKILGSFCLNAQDKEFRSLEVRRRLIALKKYCVKNRNALC